MSTPKPEDPLSIALRTWKVTPTRNPAFRPGVATRLAPGAQPLGQYMRAHRAWVALAVISLLAGGIVAGRWSAHVRAETYASQAAFEYVRAHDARWMVLR